MRVSNVKSQSVIIPL